MTSTARLGLYKPVDNELCVVETALNAQLDIMDAKAFTSLVSDTTPTADFIGQEWWKNNTKQFYYWSGTDWVEINLTTSGGGPSGPTGRKGFAVSTNTSNANAATNTENTTPFLPITFTATSGKKYEISFSGNIAISFIAAGGVQGMLNTRITSGSSVTNTGTLIHRTPVGKELNGTSTSAKNCSFIAQWTAPTTGSYTVGLFLRRTSGTDIVSFKANNYHALAVEEVG